MIKKWKVSYPAEKGYDRIWVMDDDCMPEKDALAELERIKAEKLDTVNETQVRLFGGGA